MDEHKMGMLLGMGIGILIGVVLLIFLLRITKTDRSLKCKFDERQALTRGTGFKYGFFALAVCNVIYGGLWSAIPQLPVDAGTFMILAVIFSVAVMASYCIWKDAYFSLNERRGRLMVVFGALAVCNLWIGISNIREGKAITDGALNIDSINLFCGLVLLVICAELLLKHIGNKRNAED